MRANRYKAKICGRRWLSSGVFELEISRPASFEFTPGQFVRLGHGHVEKDYTVISAPDDEALEFCIGKLGGEPYGGRVTDYLAEELGPGVYDFYLCGGSDMIVSALRIVDERYPDSLVFTEPFLGNGTDPR